MPRFKGFKKQVKAVKKAIEKKQEIETKAVKTLKKQILKERLKQLKAKKIKQVVARKRSIISPSSNYYKENEQTKQVYLGKK